ncbi:NAD(P)H-hydrate dehydratase [Blastopirellula marina]|uniref:ADP-dependent (S)-NAD(P)H-hydrate dehydratase n=1 Tax=Blastopirellula marina TaxID=124 RepID=A0A2S8GEG2_9BACT|nr:NAD(P)H-hydrate dehydratase [Blastopirellula marina]PQO42846.1 NAD(P)H-hydrate dehydratase [Blastopirellula marina]PTL46612.1 NAD(P)H-hydrate dehydratase [Blastopirellula marina]
MSRIALPAGLPVLPPRDPHSHKGTFGRALLVGGSVGMPGSISLSGRACLKGGAGLVTLAVPDAIINTVATFDAAYMTWPLPTDRSGHLPLHAKAKLSAKLEQADCLAVGPGLGQSRGLFFLVNDLASNFPRPMVIDADGLNLIAQRPDMTQPFTAPRVLTPHLGEFRRLVGKPQLTMEEATGSAIEFADKLQCVLVLKGSQTLVTDGTQQWNNPTGNPGLATGGSGDVLTGLITAMLAQQLNVYDAAVLAVFLHGLAADIAVKQTSQPGLTASDLLDFLEDALCEYAEARDAKSS